MTREAGKRARRTHSREFKSEAAALVRTGGRSVAQVAEELDVADSLARSWVQQAEVDAGQGPTGALTTAEKEGKRSMNSVVTAMEWADINSLNGASLSRSLDQANRALA